MDLCDPVFKRGALDLILDLAIPQGAFKGDELALLESPGELREIPPGPLDAVHACPGCAVATHSQGDWTESAEGDPNMLWGGSPHLVRGAQRILGRRACVRRAGVL